MPGRASTIPRLGWIVGILVAVACPSCRRDAGTDPRGRSPDARAARRAVEVALGEWRDAPPLDLTTPAARPLMFVDQQRRPGRRLRDFAILGESEADGCLRFRVRLALADPDESTLVDYYVFGADPIWVYRAEDFDMIMHMDKSMMASPESSAEAAGGRDASKAESGRPDRGPPGGG